MESKIENILHKWITLGGSLVERDLDYAIRRGLLNLEGSEDKKGNIIKGLLGYIQKSTLDLSKIVPGEMFSPETDDNRLVWNLEV